MLLRSPSVGEGSKSRRGQCSLALPPQTQPGKRFYLRMPSLQPPPQVPPASAEAVRSFPERCTPSSFPLSNVPFEPSGILANTRASGNGSRLVSLANRTPANCQQTKETRNTTSLGTFEDAHAVLGLAKSYVPPIGVRRTASTRLEPTALEFCEPLNLESERNLNSYVLNSLRTKLLPWTATVTRGRRSSFVLAVSHNFQSDVSCSGR